MHRNYHRETLKLSIAQHNNYLYKFELPLATLSFKLFKIRVVQLGRQAALRTDSAPHGHRPQTSSNHEEHISSYTLTRHITAATCTTGEFTAISTHVRRDHNKSTPSKINC